MFIITRSQSERGRGSERERGRGLLNVDEQLPDQHLSISM